MSQEVMKDGEKMDAQTEVCDIVKAHKNTTSKQEIQEIHGNL